MKIKTKINDKNEQTNKEIKRKKKDFKNPRSLKFLNHAAQENIKQ